jgi:hypothetical protein
VGRAQAQCDREYLEIAKDIVFWVQETALPACLPFPSSLPFFSILSPPFFLRALKLVSLMGTNSREMGLFCLGTDPLAHTTVLPSWHPHSLSGHLQDRPSGTGQIVDWTPGIISIAPELTWDLHLPLMFFWSLLHPVGHTPDCGHLPLPLVLPTLWLPLLRGSAEKCKP